MNRRNTFFKMSLLGMFFFLMGCQKDDTTSESPEEEIAEFEPVYFNGIAATETGNAEFPYMVQHENGEVMLLTAVGETPTGAIYFVNENTTTQVKLNEDLLPSEVNFNNEAVILFENYRQGLVDIAVIANDDFQIFRDIDFPIEGASKSVFEKNNSNNWTAVFIALGTAISTGLCVVGGAASAIGTLGITAPAAAITCGGAIAGYISLATPEDEVEINATVSTAGIGANAVGCASGLSSANPFAVAANCINTVIDGAIGFISIGSFLVDYVDAARGGLQTGDGDLKFTLTWNNDTDLDLYVTEPSGDTIWYGNTSSTTGGMLDRDDLDGSDGNGGVENIFWPTDFARPGVYRVEVKMFSGNKYTDFRVKPSGESLSLTNIISLSLQYDGESVLIGNYIVSAGSKGEMVGVWQPAEQIEDTTSVAADLYKPKN